MDATSRRFRQAIVLGAAAAGALGILQTVLKVASGKEFGIQLLAFWIGASAIAVYIALAIGAIASGLILVAVTYLNGGQEPSDRVSTPIIVVGVSIGVVSAAYVVLQGVLFDYEGTDGIGRGAFAILGLLVLAVGIRAWRHLSRSPGNDT